MRNLLTLTFAAMLALSGAAFAAGEGGGGSSGTSGGGSDSAKNCKTGEVWNKTKKKCVKAQSGVMPDEDLYQEGRGLAKAGEYEWALQVLNVIQNKDDPRVLNYMGYSNRKAGRLELGISYYEKALKLNPNFVLAREYLGEGYVAAGRIDLAKTQLAEIASRCGTHCEEYKDLAEAIASAN